jgi:hypothetical protein
MATLENYVEVDEDDVQLDYLLSFDFSQGHVDRMMRVFDVVGNVKMRNSRYVKRKIVMFHLSDWLMKDVAIGTRGLGMYKGQRVMERARDVIWRNIYELQNVEEGERVSLFNIHSDQQFDDNAEKEIQIETNVMGVKKGMVDKIMRRAGSGMRWFWNGNDNDEAMLKVNSLLIGSFGNFRFNKERMEAIYVAGLREWNMRFQSRRRTRVYSFGHFIFYMMESYKLRTGAWCVRAPARLMLQYFGKIIFEMEREANGQRIDRSFAAHLEDLSTLFESDDIACPGCVLKAMHPMAFEQRCWIWNEQPFAMIERHLNELDIKNRRALVENRVFLVVYDHSSNVDGWACEQGDMRMVATYSGHVMYLAKNYTIKLHQTEIDLSKYARIDTIMFGIQEVFRMVKKARAVNLSVSELSSFVKNEGTAYPCVARDPGRRDVWKQIVDQTKNASSSERVLMSNLIGVLYEEKVPMAFLMCVTNLREFDIFKMLDALSIY